MKQIISNLKRRSTRLLILAAMVLVGHNAWADVTYKSVDGTQVFYTTSSNITSWKTAGWAATGSSITTATKGVTIDPATDETTGSKNYDGVVLKKDNSSKKLIVYLTNVTEVKFYAKNHGTGNDRQIGVIVNDGSSYTTNLVKGETGVLDITGLSKTTTYKFDIYGYEEASSKANDVFLYAIKAYGAVSETLCTVTFDATTNGGSCSTSSIKQSTKGASVTLPSATKSNRSFLGWATSAGDPSTIVGGYNDSYTPTTDIKLYAIFGFAFNDNVTNDFTTAQGTTDNVQINRTFYKGKVKNTICLPFSLSASQLAESPLKGCTLTEISGATVKNEGTVNQVIKLTYTTATAIVAGKPYIISWEGSGSIANPIFANVTFPSTVSASSTTVNGVTLYGLLTPLSVETADDKSIMFINSDGILKWPSSGGTINAFRCYFGISAEISE